MKYTYNGQEYELNLIDTPGHVDFHYEVSRSLACCEGAVLLVDAFQGVEAQTVANAYAAMEHDLTIVPVINKIDLTHARVDEVLEEMEHTLAIDADEVLGCSAQDGPRHARTCSTAVIERVPPPTGDPEGTLQAMVFDSHYDEYRGAVTYVRVMNGTVAKGQKIKLPASRHDARSDRARPVHARSAVGRDELHGRPGRLPHLQHQVAGQRPHRRHGHAFPATSRPPALPGYQEPKRMVYCGLYPSDGQDFEQLRDALDKLSINDPSFEFEPETSDALGFGFRCGFLGLLHMEIVQQRLEQESDIDLVQTAPNVTYEIVTRQRRDARSPHAAGSARPGRDRGVPPADRARELHAADRVHRPDHEALHRPPRRATCGPSTCRRRGRCSSTTCRWPT